ncbi:bifunctional diguanylate cyclase/phosphodiesterase [Vibrio albus]|uniref:cyclic-guanylate-specific phosphodiesterase n=1 Tax=Vibrio albus TaxID=2200953 RepID=A0A2U3B8R7_9VIBR|nr:bacteriohemerythrin [Vibrio albus]PWI33199.1 bifunctional diguanylate cyclase/phosphodiesterase [Vibrio albus]
MALDEHIDIFPWYDSFNIGIPEIDEQHKQLVSILNRVASFISFQNSTLNLDDLILELVDYAVYHFNTEDNYWLSTISESEPTDKHHNSHLDFIQRVHDFEQKTSILTEEEWLDELLSFLAGWLASHILESDKYMALLAKAVQSGMSLDEAKHSAEKQMRENGRNAINIILAAYKSLSSNAIRLMREIKAKNQALDMHLESERQLQAVMDYAQIGHWSLRYADQSAEWSPQIYRLFGIAENTTPELESFFCIMSQDSQKNFLDSVQHSFETGEEHRMVYQIERVNDGAKRWIECRGKVVYGEDGIPEKISGFLQDVTDRKQDEEQITQLAYYDPLTQLPNRRLLLDRLNQTIAMTQRSQTYNVLLCMDIDDFKTWNDSHGHEYGDILLQEISTRIQSCLYQGDTVSRVGGDEFVIILSNFSGNSIEVAAKAESVANRVALSISEPYFIRECQCNISASIGMVLFNDNRTSAHELMKQADIAMYQAKEGGKNTVRFYDPLMQQEIKVRMKLENELRIAIEEQQFTLFYQPQVDQSGRIFGAEALIRWNHPLDGLVCPDRFIPIAEETGLIIPMGDWVLDTACQQLNLWQQDENRRDLTLSVNVSYVQFRQPSFVDKVCELMQKYQLEHGKLKLELTESLFVDDIELVISRMTTLNNLGIEFSIDDFGTGYSSLQYIKRLPLSQLKIDRAFVSALDTNMNDQSIVNMIILMAKELGMSVIAEGVENQSQREHLEKFGCLNYQGYFFSKPIPIEEFISLSAPNF